MKRKPDTEAAEQAQPTQPRRMDENGFELDQHGLPLCGPRRIAVLAEMGLPDPNDDPAGFAAGKQPQES